MIVHNLLWNVSSATGLTSDRKHAQEQYVVLARKFLVCQRHASFVIVCPPWLTCSRVYYITTELKKCLMHSFGSDFNTTCMITGLCLSFLYCKMRLGFKTQKLSGPGGWIVYANSLRTSVLSREEWGLWKYQKLFIKNVLLPSRKTTIFWSVSSESQFETFSKVTFFFFNILELETTLFHILF